MPLKVLEPMVRLQPPGALCEFRIFQLAPATTDHAIPFMPMLALHDRHSFLKAMQERSNKVLWGFTSLKAKQRRGMLRNRALAPARFSSSRPRDRKATFAACSSTSKARNIVLLACEKARFHSLTTSINNCRLLKCASSLCFIFLPTASHGLSWLEFHGHFPKFTDRLRPL